MTDHQRPLLLVVFAAALLASACVDNPFDNSCPAGYWRPHAMSECEPVPVPDAGRDSGPTPVEDAGTDAAAPSDAGSDAAVDDAGASDAGASDADVTDADVSDADVAADADVEGGSAGDGG